MNINATTKVCMVIGDPIDHSLSPLIHNSGYEALGITDQFVYIASRIAQSDIKDFIHAIKIMGIRGVSCTMPHKFEVIPYLDTITDVAKKIGAVNTIINDNGILTGDNTDYLGCITPLLRHTTLANKKVAVIGAGGAARAIVYGLSMQGADVTVYNRTLEKALLLAQDFRCSAKTLGDIDDIKNADIIINATPIGMAPLTQESPIPKDCIGASQIVFDTIYSPHTTQLIRDALEKNASVIYGSDMLLYQATAQFELFTTQKAPVEAMKKALEEH